jgi:hypothetical protein
MVQKKLKDLPCVRWTSYNKTLDAYHGELIKKDKYTRKFLKLNDTSGYYDSEKIKYLLDHLYGEWVGRNA